jgi:hypothetical protein
MAADIFVLLIGGLNESDGQPEGWRVFGRYGSEGAAHRAAIAARTNDTYLRVFADSDGEMMKLLVDSAAERDKPAKLYGISITDKLGSHSVLHDVGWLTDRAQAEALASTVSGHVIESSSNR